MATITVFFTNNTRNQLTGRISGEAEAKYLGSACVIDPASLRSAEVLPGETWNVIILEDQQNRLVVSPVEKIIPIAEEKKPLLYLQPRGWVKRYTMCRALYIHRNTNEDREVAAFFAEIKTKNDFNRVRLCKDGDSGHTNHFYHPDVFAELKVFVGNLRK